MEHKNIIIGAGISGLSCGWTLKDSCIILEKESQIGGLAATKKFSNFKFDLGGHRFFTHNPALENFFRHLLQGEILESDRKSKIYRNGKLIDYPLQASIISQLNPLEITLSFLTYILRKIKPLPELSFQERAINRFGDHLYKLFFKDYTQKVWGISCDNISKELVSIRLQNVSLMRVIRHALIRDKNIRTFADKILYPGEGIGMIAEKLAGGLDIRLNSEITGLACSNGRIEKVVVNNAEGYPCKNLVSTMPVTKLTDFFSAPSDVRRAAGNLKYRSLICVFLVLNKKNYTRNHWIYVPGEYIFGRIHEPKNWSPYMAPENETGVCVEIFCNKDDDIWRMDNRKIANQVIRTLPLLKEFEAEDHCVVRVEYAYPIYDIHYRKNMEKLKAFLSSFKNLFLLGRVGSFRYINMDACIEEGLRLGELLLKRLNPKARQSLAEPAFLKKN